MSTLLAAAAALLLGAGSPPATPETTNRETPQSSVTRQAEVPAISFDRMEHDLGTLRLRSKPQTAVFTFTNTGSAPLAILRTERSCDCLSVKYPRKPLLPGESGTLEITYTPKKGTGAFANNVKIYTNTPDGRPDLLFIRGNVVK